MRLSHKIAVVTGAGGGIGRAAAVRFAREGAMVFAVDINVDGNRETAELSDAIEPLTVDVSDGQSVSAMVQTVLDRHGRLDVLFSNAGIMRDGNVIDLEEDDWDAMFGVNVKGAFLCGKYGIPAMRDSGGGSFIITAANVSDAVSPSKTRLPPSISSSTTPNAQMSARLSTGLPLACSGAM